MVYGIGGLNVEKIGPSPRWLSPVSVDDIRSCLQNKNYTVMYGEVQLIQKKHPCVNLWNLFGDVAASIFLIQISYATINTIYCGLGGLNKEGEKIEADNDSENGFTK